MGEPVFRRLNPLTILVEVLRFAWRFIYLFIFVLLSRGSGTDFMYEAIGGVVVIAAIWRYFSTSYAVHQGTLIVKTGFFVRNQRTIPLSAIQNINVNKSFIHRVLGLVDLKIETAAGAQAEASLSALSASEAEALKRELRAGVRREEAPPEPEFKTVGRTVYKISTKELLLTGATENRAFAILGTIFGGSFIFQDRLVEVFRRLFPNFGDDWVMVAVVGFMFFLVGWVFSIISAIVSYANFEVNLHEGNLRRHYGLLNQIESVVPLPRVQIMRTSETLFQRWLRLCKLYVETAGSFEKQDLGGSSLLCPLIESQRVAETARMVLPGRPVNEVVWRPVSKKTIITYFRGAFLVYAVLVAGSAIYFGPKAFWALVPLAAWSVFSGWMHYKTTGFDDRPNLLAARHGVLSRHTSYVPPEKIQSVSVSQSPFQRRLRLSTVHVHTAAMTHGSAQVPDLEEADAATLAHGLHRRSADAARLTGEAI